MSIDDIYRCCVDLCKSPSEQTKVWGRDLTELQLKDCQAISMQKN